VNRRKRIADWLEKASVASFAIGVFQWRWEGITLSALLAIVSYSLTDEERSAE
jgi:hypothetical protein